MGFCSCLSQCTQWISFSSGNFWCDARTTIESRSCRVSTYKLQSLHIPLILYRSAASVLSRSANIPGDCVSDSVLMLLSAFVRSSIPILVLLSRSISQAFLPAMKTSQPQSSNLPGFHSGMNYHTHRKCSKCSRFQRCEFAKLNACSRCQVTFYCVRFLVALHTLALRSDHLVQRVPKGGLQGP